MTTQPRGLLDISGYDAHIRQSAADAARNFRPAPPVIAPLPRQEFNSGSLEKAFDITSKMLDGQTLGVWGLLGGVGRTSREMMEQAQHAADAFGRSPLKWIDRVLVPAQEFSGAVADTRKGIPGHIAYPGAALRTGGTWAGIAGGAAIGTAVGGPLGGLFGGAVGGLAADGLLPNREPLGRGLLNVFKAYGKNPFYGMP